MQENQEQEKETKKKNRVLTGVKWVLRASILILILVLAAIYMPFVQDFAIPKVLKAISTPDMEIRAGKVRLGFPLDLKAENVLILQQADTMVAAADASLEVALMPLLKGQIKVENIALHDAVYNAGNEDSLLMMRARLRKFDLDKIDISLSHNEFNISEANADGISLRMRIRPDSVEKEVADTTSSTDMKILARKISIRNLNFFMELEGTIDSLSAQSALVELIDGKVDLKAQTVDAEKFAVDSLFASYFYPPAKAAESAGTASTDSIATLPWTIRATDVELKNSGATYALSGATPVNGLDMNYLQASKINIGIDSLYNRGTAIRVPVRRLSAEERCGLEANLSGLFAMDSTGMEAKNILLSTGPSHLQIDAYMGMDTLAARPVRLDASASISPEDVRKCFPSLSPLLRNLPYSSMLTLEAKADGTTDRLTIDELAVALTGIAYIEADGEFLNLTDFNNLIGNVDIKGRVRDGKRITRTLTQAKLAPGINVPDLSLSGNIRADRGTFGGKIKALTDSGHVALDGNINITREIFRANLDADAFPVSSFMPDLGVGRVTASVKADGNRFNPIAKGADITATIEVSDVDYRGVHYKDIDLHADIADGRLDALLNSPNPEARFNIAARGQVYPQPLDLDFTADIGNLDLHALGIMPTESYLKTQMSAHAIMNLDSTLIDAELDVASLEAKLDSATSFSTSNILLNFVAADSSTSAKITNGDLTVDFFSPLKLDSVTARFAAAADTLNRTILSRHANMPALRNTLPVFRLDINAGANNIAGSYLASKQMSFRKLDFSLGRDSVIHAGGRILRFKTGTTRLDTITLNILQIQKYLTFEAALNNIPGNMDEFAHVEANGYLINSKAGVFLNQRDVRGKVGYKIGATAEFVDSVIRLNFVPYNPVIGYKDWTINSDNVIELNLAKKHLDANLLARSAESSIHLYTEHVDSLDTQEDIILNVKNIKIQEWVSFNPFAPQMKGDLNADIRLSADKGQLTGNGNVSLNEFFYGGKRVGSFDLAVDVTAAQGQKLRADVTLMVDSVKTITAYGHLNDTASANPFLLDFRMIRFPLSVANPFLPPQTGSLSGVLNGQMDITGDLANPIFNGFLDFDSTAFTIDMLGSTLNFSNAKIPMDSNVVKFDNFAITAVNKNPLLINGEVDLRSFAHPMINLALKANNMQLVGNTRKPKNADLYGRAFISLDATATGPLSELDVDAALRILPETNVTYVVPDATNALQSRANSEMVKFVNFTDSLAVAEADSIKQNPTNININALLTIEDGCAINVDLAAGSKNKLQLKPSGNLDFSMSSLNPARLSGRININSGMVAYTPPFMSEKVFNFQEGSYVAFNGAMMDPVLNIHAVDNLKANVTQAGQNSRLVTFNILLGITGTLNQMNVGFDLATNEDITIQNELASMSADQRANQAMNLLLYNIYTGPGTKGNANIGGNALYSFLESQVNSWAANNIRGVDLSFGIDQYDQTTNGLTSKTTSYSYRLSKSLFNDRFKIVVGGAYTDDNNPEQNVALNLINDISLEYILNKNGTMVIKIFRHTGYESILEGEITQTGIGFVYKRKIDRLIDLFKPFRRTRPTVLPVPENQIEK